MVRDVRRDVDLGQSEEMEKDDIDEKLGSD